MVAWLKFQVFAATRHDVVHTYVHVGCDHHLGPFTAASLASDRLVSPRIEPVFPAATWVARPRAADWAFATAFLPHCVTGHHCGPHSARHGAVNHPPSGQPASGTGGRG